MAQSRHGRTGGGPPSAGSGLPSWAQRHLDEAGERGTAVVGPAAGTRRHGHAPAEPSRLRGWGVAIVAVAAAVGSVPLAISSLANDHSGDPLPKVDTYTAGSPGPLQADGGTGRHRAPAPGVATAPGTDPATGGVLQEPAAAPVIRAPAVPARAFAGPVPAAVVRATPTVTPTPVTKPATPRSATPTTPTSTTTTTTGDGRSATKPSKPKPPKSSGGGSGNTSGGGSGNGSGGGSSNGGGGGLLGGVTNTVGGLTNTVGSAANGLLGGG